METNKTRTHYIPRRLLTVLNAKTIKGEKLGYLTGVLYLAPSTVSGIINVCPKATKACIAACLYTAGRGIVPAVRQGRINKTHYYYHDRQGFTEHLAGDIARLVKRAGRQSLIPAVRINGTSDLAGLAMSMACRFPDVQFYDYTKLPKPEQRMRSNYRLTFSYSGSNLAESLKALDNGVNVSVVFATRKGQPLPDTWHGYPVIDGDLHDLRFLDPRGVVVGLRAKGPAKKQTSPFIVLA